MMDLSYEAKHIDDGGLYDIAGNLKFVPLVHQGDGCSYWRIMKPFEAMGFDFMKDGGKTLEQYLETANVVTFNRTPGFALDVFLKWKVKYGFKVVIDWDDYWILPHDHLIYKSWNQQQMPKIADEMVKTVADHITVTTERLADKIRKHTDKPITVIPNAIPIGKGQWENKEEKLYGGEHKNILTRSGKIVDEFGTRFGYVAGSSHLPDLKYFAPVLNHFPTLKFALCGYNNPDERRGVKNVWDSMERLASFNYNNPNYRRVKTTGFDNYARAYDHIDVAIAPLKDNEFNSFKSSLKAYEAGAKKCALIATRTAPYTDDIPEGIATFCSSNSEWVEAIRRHKDVGFVKEQADKLYEWVVANRNLNNIAKQRLQFFNSII